MEKFNDYTNSIYKQLTKEVSNSRSESRESNVQFDYCIGDSVYLKTDNDQLERLVTGILIRLNGVMFELSQSNTSSYHFSFEISSDKDILKTSTN
ncbi:MAG: hypothetical protein WC959_12455 [Kiritimatiellales bacterium]